MKSVEIKTIGFSGLSFSFDEEHRVLNDCTFDLPMETVVRLNGPHGCGKSTILKLLAGLIDPKSGDYNINGESFNEMSFEELIPYRLKIGYGFEYGGLINNRTIFQNLILPIEYHKIKDHAEAKKHVEEIIEVFGLQRSSRYRPSAVSGGQRKLACIARAFVMDPEVLILDEPTHGLNERTIEILCNFIRGKMEAGIIKHVFLTTENPVLIEGLVKKDLIIQDGKILDFDNLYESVAGEKAS